MQYQGKNRKVGNHRNGTDLVQPSFIERLTSAFITFMSLDLVLIDG